MALLQQTDLNWFRAQRNRADNAYQLGYDQNKFDRKVSDEQQRWRTTDLGLSHTAQNEQFARPWNRKGMMNSGMYNKAFGELRARHIRDTQRNTLGAGWRTEGFDMAGNQLAAIRDQTTKELREQQEAYQNQVDAVLRADGYVL